MLQLLVEFEIIEMKPTQESKLTTTPDIMTLTFFLTRSSVAH